MVAHRTARGCVVGSGVWRPQTSMPVALPLNKKNKTAIRELNVLEHREENQEMHLLLHAEAVVAVIDAQEKALDATIHKQHNAKMKEVASAGHLKDHGKIALDPYSFMERGWTPGGPAPMPSRHCGS